jgi:hypothetical protein
MIHQPITSDDIASLHQKSILDWKNAGIHHHHQGFLQLIEENHAYNYRLWHAEDSARRDDMGYEFVYHAKREIDTYNQQRNNRMEAMDEWLYQALQPLKPGACPVNSESPGMMIDRLSILALKHYHMALQTKRDDITEQHRSNCAAKVVVIEQQLLQLKQCLDALIEEVIAKKRTFRVYHQFKMYNDPSLNPELYNPS